MSTSSLHVRLGTIRPWAKFSVVFGGYAIAYIVASVVLSIRYAQESLLDRQSAMVGFGDTLYFLAVFGMVGIIPTGAALFFLRPYRRLWAVLARLSLVSAAFGVAALAAEIVYSTHRAIAGSALTSFAQWSVLRLIPAPGFAVAMILGLLFAPDRRTRLLFLLAAIAECAVCVYLLVWLFWLRHP